MDDQWVKGSSMSGGIAHVHPDGSRYKTDRRMPILVDPNVTPRVWRATYVCRECSAMTDREWVDERDG